MASQTVIYHKKERIAWLTLNRPHAGNTINGPLAGELSEACREINQDDEVAAVVVTGTGEAFCSGTDLSELAPRDPVEPETANPASQASRAVAAVNCPVIAAINGDCLGGGLELALSCDIRVCSENAQFGFPEVCYGLIPCGGGTQRLPRVVGKGKATEMILTGESVDALEAHRIGLVAKVVPKDTVLAAAGELAGKLISRAPIAVRYAKEAVYKGADMTLEQGLRLEADLSFLLQTTGDRAEGIKAFLEKRTGDFKGR